MDSSTSDSGFSAGEQCGLDSIRTDCPTLLNNVDQAVDNDDKADPVYTPIDNQPIPSSSLHHSSLYSVSICLQPSIPVHHPHLSYKKNH